MQRTSTLALLVLLGIWSGCGSLAEHGVNTVSIGYGVKRSSNILFGKGISHITLENLDDTPHTEARISVEFILGNGDVLKKQFHVGTLDAGQEWEKELDSIIKDVDSIDFFYTCKEGAGKGTLDVKNADWKSEKKE